jgi:hypothetical protein
MDGKIKPSLFYDNFSITLRPYHLNVYVTIDLFELYNYRVTGPLKEI